MSYQRVVVLRGGPSAEYEVSMQTGGQVIRALPELGYAVRDIVITRQGEWLEHGLVYQPQVALSTADIVFIALHGDYGEDGTIQRICERLHIPFTGSNSLASRTAFNKHTTKQLVADSAILLPGHVLLTPADLPQLATKLESVTSQWVDGLVVKPVASGSSHGVEVFTDFDDALERLTNRLLVESALLVEERIVGTETTCGILEDFRGDRQYVLPLVEIVPPVTSTHFDAHVKYSGDTAEICPGRFSYPEKAAVAEATRYIHTRLGLSHYSRADFIIRAGQPYFLEINSLPGLTAESLFPKAAQAMGLDFNYLIQHLVTTAKVC